MLSLRFRDLISLLPTGDTDRLLPKNQVPGLSRISASNPCFVEPDLLIETEIMPDKTSVVLLSAPAAVGKSTVAAELALHCSASLWDLSKIRVGSNTFIGTIYAAYDTFGHGVLKRLEGGNFLFILDALDEAQVRAGSANFDAFIDDLVSLLKEPRTKPVLVLLARSDTADWIELKFMVENVPYARLQIANFNKPQAVEFIDKRLDVIRENQHLHPVHHQQRDPYVQARSRLFSLILNLLGVPDDHTWGDSRINSFLGYAPVLEALTDYLNVPNFHILSQELENEPSAAHDPWHFLAEIVSKLLVRESKKMRDALRSSLETEAGRLGWSDWDELYTNREQCSRVLELSLGLPHVQVEQGPPGQLADEYESKMRLSLPQHPFLAEGSLFANIVFKEFLYAWGITKGYPQLAQGLRKVMRDRQAPYLPSQLFSRFALMSDVGAVPVLDGLDFGALYDSILTRTEIANDLSISIYQDGDVMRFSATVDQEGGGEIECELLNTGEGIHIWRQLKRADIDIDAPAEIGLSGQRFSLGPSVTLSCSRLTVTCDDLEVDASEPIQLSTNLYNPGSQNLRILVRKGAPASLAAFWPDISYPWVSYRGSETAAILRLGEDVRGDAFRKLILFFYRQRSRKMSSILNTRWSAKQLGVRDELIELARKFGVLTRTGRGGDDFFVFNSDYDSLRTLIAGTPKLSDAALRFFTAYFGAERSKKILQ